MFPLRCRLQLQCLASLCPSLNRGMSPSVNHLQLCRLLGATATHGLSIHRQGIRQPHRGTHQPHRGIRQLRLRTRQSANLVHAPGLPVVRDLGNGLTVIIPRQKLCRTVAEALPGCKLGRLYRRRMVYMHRTRFPAWLQYRRIILSIMSRSQIWLQKPGWRG